MKLLCLGLSYRTAPVALRERLHYSAGALKEALACARSLLEVVLLSTCNRLSGLGQAERQQIELLTQSLVNKLLHDPTLRLKAEAGAGDASSSAEAVRHLFALNS